MSKTSFTNLEAHVKEVHIEGLAEDLVKVSIEQIDMDDMLDVIDIDTVIAHYGMQDLLERIEELRDADADKPIAYIPGFEDLDERVAKLTIRKGN
jgi:hypothetical protein